MSNKDIALSIIDFLKSSVANKTIAEDYAESMDVAIDCIADAFEVDAEAKSSFGKSLPELIQHGLSSSSSSKPVEASTTKAASATEKVAADALKAEGNKAMAARDFPEAIAKYSAAIALDPHNVVYLSNRAAAYSSSNKHAEAAVDAENAIELDPTFAKAYSRLGLARYALGDAKAAMNAYKSGIDAEGEKKSDAMAKGYETAKRRVEEDLENSIAPVESSSRDVDAAAAAPGAAGMPDLSSMFGGGGMPDLSSMFGGAGGGGMPDLAGMMNNPQIMKAAQEMMSNPDALLGLMSNPAVRQMAQSMGMGGADGGAPDLSSIMNNPMFSQFMNKDAPPKE